ncbi:5-histidylcysteine sulfoxide synthase [Sulfurimonas sp.]|uniref:5-histidylcysteine sulfoxide synthase n=1 Tax=Sulfurimonas sp. TaxID=2022749 RepID=UPI0035699013
MSKLSLYPPTLHGTTIEDKRQEILEYFHNTYDLFEMMFEILKDDIVFYKKSEPTRHPMIFYFGHTAVFYINKLINMNIIDKRINENFESIFAVGVDEMEWDDLDPSRYKWPEVSQVREYRNKVRERVDKLIKEIDFTLPITWDSDMWIVLMAIEHERIHIETSSVLHRQMPLEFIKEIPEFKTWDDMNSVVYNSLVKIPKTHVKLGKEYDDKYYGWDNEYGIYEEEVEEFSTSKYLVSNAEFMEFVKEGGYEKKEYWCDEGKEFLKKTNAKHPPFWIKEDKGYSFRALTKKIRMPLSWPVEVNNLEAMAFCRYKSKKDAKDYTLPSEAEYEAICKYVGVEDIQSEFYANHNFDMIGSVSVNINEYFSADQNSLYDVVGNVWQHSRTPIRPFEGFRVHEAYDDFTTPTYDEKHALILGSSWASSGNLIMKHSRYAFRRHFYQHAGFRYVQTNMKNDKNTQADMMDDIKKNYKLQFESEFYNKIIPELLKYIDKRSKALDLACGCGMVSLELSSEFEKVEGIEFSARFIKEAIEIKNNSKNGYKNVEFWQGDIKNLKPNFKDYDFVFLSNLKEKKVDVDSFLKYAYTRMNESSVFVLLDFENCYDSNIKDKFSLLDKKEIEGYQLSVWRKS